MDALKELRNHMIYKLEQELNGREFEIHANECENDYVITIYPRWDWDILTIPMLKKWVKESGVSFSKMSGNKRKPQFIGRDYLQLCVYK
jgi:hypothetical protein